MYGWNLGQFPFSLFFQEYGGVTFLDVMRHFIGEPFSFLRIPVFASCFRIPHISGLFFSVKKVPVSFFRAQIVSMLLEMQQTH